MNIDYSTQDTCCICCREYTENESVYSLPDCGHKYHTECIINWYITTDINQCPYCRNVPNPINFSINNFLLLSRRKRFTFMQKLGRRKECPKQLKNAIEKYRNTINNGKNIRKEIRLINNNPIFKELYKKRTMLRRKERTNHNRLYKWKSVITDFPILPLIQ
jgi:Ring finger domain